RVKAGSIAAMLVQHPGPAAPGLIVAGAAAFEAIGLKRRRLGRRQRRLDSAEAEDLAKGPRQPFQPLAAGAVAPQGPDHDLLCQDQIGDRALARFLPVRLRVLRHSVLRFAGASPRGRLFCK
ncbi:MAG: hypothetical protein ACKVP5_07270, partial [Aestuariivirga sp.]